MFTPTKKIFVDPGNFYTKIIVMKADGSGGFEFYGKTFFPSTVTPAAKESGISMLYGNQEEGLFAVGRDALVLGGFTYEEAKLHPWGWRRDNGKSLVTKILYDYVDEKNEQMEVTFLYDSAEKLALLKEVVKDYSKDDELVPVEAFRHLDQHQHHKNTEVKFNYVPVSDVLLNYLTSFGEEFRKSIVVDIAHNDVKLFIIDSETGVSLFKTIEIGVSTYYEKIMKLLTEQAESRVNYGWLIKQIECGITEIEVVSEMDTSDGDGLAISLLSERLLGKPSVLLNHLKQRFDINDVIENVRWDLNKDIKNMVYDTLVTYCSNNAINIDILAIIGGGANYNGEILAQNLEEEEISPDIIVVNEIPLYTLVKNVTEMC
ncbi:MAG: hypothetical protein ISR65_03145 [Bacteriovoracaceae bacterium]|nr:hypothetical protein [Bacteriovoracaceae bacterium]